MTTKEIIESLRKSGNKIEYRKRKDGGYLITSINGIKYTGSKGNTRARTMAGYSLSKKRIEQLASIKPNLGQSPNGRKRKTLPRELLLEIKSAQRLWNKNVSDEASGKITRKKIRYIYENYGYAQAHESLGKSKRYARGIAYEENVKYLANRIKNYDEDLAKKILAKKDKFKEEWILKIYEKYYELDNLVKNGAPQDIIDQTEKEIRTSIIELLKTI